MEGKQFYYEPLASRDKFIEIEIKTGLLLALKFITGKGIVQCLTLERPAGLIGPFKKY